MWRSIYLAAKGVQQSPTLILFHWMISEGTWTLLLGSGHVFEVLLATDDPDSTTPGGASSSCTPASELVCPPVPLKQFASTEWCLVLVTSDTYWIRLMYLLDPHLLEITGRGCLQTFSSRQSFSPVMLMSSQLQPTLDKNAASVSSSSVTFSTGNKEATVESMAGFASLFPCGRIKLGFCKPSGSTHLSASKEKEEPLECKILGIEEEITVEITLGSPSAPAGSVDISRPSDTTTFIKSCTVEGMLSTVTNEVCNKLPAFPSADCLSDTLEVDASAEAGRLDLHVSNDCLSTLSSSIGTIPVTSMSCCMFCARICKIEESAIGDKAKPFSLYNPTLHSKVMEGIAWKQGACGWEHAFQTFSWFLIILLKFLSWLLSTWNNCLILPTSWIWTAVAAACYCGLELRSLICQGVCLCYLCMNWFVGEWSFRRSLRKHIVWCSCTKLVSQSLIPSSWVHLGMMLWY